MSAPPSDAGIRAAIAARADLLRETIDFVHAHPELAHEERACAAHLVGVLRAAGLHVDTGIGAMETAFRARLRGARPGRSVGIVALYDAVPSVPAGGGIVPVHSCGHGPIAAATAVAAAALAAHADMLAGEVVIMGCPADEIHAPGTVAQGGGKGLSAAAGAWDELDAALYAHPEPIDTAWTASAWMRRDTAVVAGRRTLVDGAPQPPFDAVRAALDAVADIPRARGMLEHLDLDGDVEEGGGLVARARFLLWSPDERGLDELAERLRTTLVADWETGVVVPGIAPDQATRAAVADAIRAAGRTYVEPAAPLPFATDFGAVTRRVPSALVGIGRPGGWAFHTDQGAVEFASEDGVRLAAGMAEVLALAALRLTGTTDGGDA